jgi:hypothetical protein
MYAYWVESYVEQGRELFSVIFQERGKSPRPVGEPCKDAGIAWGQAEVHAHRRADMHGLQTVRTVLPDWARPYDPDQPHSRAAWVM